MATPTFNSFFSIAIVLASFGLDAPTQAIQPAHLPDRLPAQNHLLLAQSGAVRYVPAAAASAPSSGRGRGGASRGNCGTDEPLMALVPIADTGATSSIGLTTNSHPTFWFSLPQSLTPDRPAEFLLLNPAGDYIYTASLNRSEAGIVKVELPSTVTPLEAGETYRWMFQITCESGEQIDTWGELQRVTLDPQLQAQIDRTSGRDRAILYAANGIWHDALTLLATLQLNSTATDPLDSDPLASDWATLLESANLSEVADQPLLNCCTPAR